jgi:hypothetical protein
MAIIDQVSAPLVLRDPNGNEKVIAAAFTHPQGLLCLDLFWHQSTPDQAAHLIRGELSGEGPWRIGDHRVRVLGCHNTDPHLADQYATWSEYLANNGDQYPPRQQIVEIARKMGAVSQKEDPSAP